MPDEKLKLLRQQVEVTQRNLFLATDKWRNGESQLDIATERYNEAEYALAEYLGRGKGYGT